MADTLRIPGGEWPPQILFSGRNETSEEQCKARFLELPRAPTRVGDGDFEFETTFNVRPPSGCESRPLGVDRDPPGIHSKEL